jgi:Flp pilus assembly protein TadG
MIVILMVMVGLGLDTGQLTYVRNQGQSAVDAAALAAVTGLASTGTPAQKDAEVKARAKGFNSTNDYSNSANSSIGDADVSYVTYDFAANTITKYNATIDEANGVRVSREAGRGIVTPIFLTPIMNLFGISTPGTQTVNVSAVATITSKPAIPIALWQAKCGVGTGTPPVYPLQTNVNIEMQHPDQSDAAENACWTTFFDCSSGAPDIKAGFQTASTCSGSAIDGNVTLGSMICQNKGQVNTVMQKAQDFFLNTSSNVGRWWIIPVVVGTGNCAAKDPTAIVDFAKIRVTGIVKTGSPKYITADIQCGQKLTALDESLCFTHRLVREPNKGY